MSEIRKAALLVGAGDAIGAAVARRFAAGGYAVCIARRDPSKSQPLVEEMKAAGHEVHAFAVDARKEAEVQSLCEQVERDVGPIEVCLFNAGSNVNKPLLETTERLFFKAWELACYAGFLVGREAARYMSLQRAISLATFPSRHRRSRRDGWAGAATVQDRLARTSLQE